MSRKANLVKNNYGHAGKIYIDYIEQIMQADSECIKREYKKLFKDIIDETETTDKQALSMALMLLADRLACDCIFDDEPLTIEDVKQYVVPESAVRVEERAYSEVVSLISRNKNKFDDMSNDIWGKIQDDVVTINKQVLEQELNKLGFDFNSIKKGWAKSEYILKNTAGRYIHQTRVYGIRGDYIKIQMPDDAFEEVDASQNPFDKQQSLT